MLFGSTGHSSSRCLFGAAALGKVDQDRANVALDVLLEHGVNHIDTAASYGNGESEKRIAPWMTEHRSDFFLATKSGQRTYDDAKAEFEGSLERLGVDSVDLIQLHNLTDPDEWRTAMGENGALKAVVEARDAGLTRFIGVTGHGLQVASMHMKSLDEFPFDSVLLPLNFPLMQNPQYAADFNMLSNRCRDSGIAVQTIKSIARGHWGEKDKTRSTWYEPLEEQPDIDKAVWWVLGHEGVFLNTAGDVDLLPKVLSAAGRAAPRPTDDEMSAIASGREMVALFPRP